MIKFPVVLSLSNDKAFCIFSSQSLSSLGVFLKIYQGIFDFEWKKTVVYFYANKLLNMLSSLLPNELYCHAMSGQQTDMTFSTHQFF